jgi:hypothetical protein
MRGFLAWIEIEHQAILKASTRHINRVRRLSYGKRFLRNESPMMHVGYLNHCISEKRTGMYAAISLPLPEHRPDRTGL